MRTFIAIDLPSELKKQIATYYENIQASTPGIKWVKAVNYHITLKFLGETADEQVMSIKRRLSHIAAITAPFYLQIGKGSAFPSTRRPRVIWLEVLGETERASKLATLISQAMSAEGFAEEKTGLHLTLGRLKKKEVLHQWPSVLEETMDPQLGFAVNSFSWYQSILTGREPQYRLLEKFALRG